MRCLIVIPTYNEIDNLQPLIETISREVHSDGSFSNVHVLVVDDGSPDGTGKLADHLAQKNPWLFVIHRAGKQGLGTAYLKGFAWGLEKGYDAIIEMDADFSHHPKYLPTMISLLRKNDVVVGSRYVAGGGTLNWGVGRKLISRGGSLYSRLILGATIRDFTGGFNGWTRKALEKLNLNTVRSDGYSFQIELKYRAFRNGLKMIEFPIIFEDRKVGQSKMSSRIVLEALRKVWQFRCSS